MPRLSIYKGMDSCPYCLTELNDATIERAARAMNLEAGRQRGLAFEKDWDDLTEQERGDWRLCARAGLVAGVGESRATE
jgi:hypothetical protein